MKRVAVPILFVLLPGAVGVLCAIGSDLAAGRERPLAGAVLFAILFAGLAYAHAILAFLAAFLVALLATRQRALDAARWALAPGTLAGLLSYPTAPWDPLRMGAAVLGAVLAAGWWFVSWVAKLARTGDAAA